MKEKIISFYEENRDFVLFSAVAIAFYKFGFHNGYVEASDKMRGIAGMALKLSMDLTSEE